MARQLIVPSLLFGLVIVFLWLTLFSRVTDLLGSAAAGESPGGFAVVELFTSEGCSSCPPADAVFAELAARRGRGEQVYCLGFHVDYWDYLGWKDRFASAEASQRQRQYARVFGANRVYTPQMVVNGTTEFVGSDRPRAVAAVNEVLRRSAEAMAIQLLPKRDGNTLSVRIVCRGAAANRSALLALVENEAQSAVTAGENRGRQLHHVSLVRAFQAVPLDAEGSAEATLVVPADAKADACRIVGVIQDRATGAVASAADLAFPR